MEPYIAIAIPILILTAWLYTAQITRSSLPNLHGKRICLLIAHPDDEAMFFSPTVTALTAQKVANHLKILCLSNGNAQGLGEMRKEELAASATILGLRSASDVFVIEDPKFQDSMTATWSADDIEQVLSSAFSPSISSSQKKSQASNEPTATIDVLITFDKHGISSHPNHRSLYHGARHWLSSLTAGKAGWKCPVELYTLTTTNILRKYASFLDAPLTMVIGSLRVVGLGRRKKREEPASLLYVSDFGQYRKGQQAMVRAHKSQMVWFRWGWIIMGRYMVVNDLKRETVA